MRLFALRIGIIDPKRIPFSYVVLQMTIVSGRTGTVILTLVGESGGYHADARRTTCQSLDAPIISKAQNVTLGRHFGEEECYSTAAL
jgi:hypothetical protein